MTALVPSIDFDFSKYQPGDVLIFKLWTKREHDAAREFVDLARAKGLNIRMEYDAINMEARVQFK